MKKLLLAGLVCLATVGAVITSPTAEADRPFPKQCIAVLCLPCPDGTVPDPRPNDCCRCVPQQ